MQPLTYIVLHALLFRRYYFKISDLHSVVAGSGNNIQLLLSCQIDKLNCITGNTDSEVCILLFFRMLHSIDQFLFAKYIYVQVMCTLVEISVQYMYQIICTLFITMSKSFRINGLCIGNSIQCILIVKLCNRVQGSKKSVLLCAVGWVCTRCQRLSSLSSIRKSSGSFTINNVRSNGKNRSGWLESR